DFAEAIKDYRLVLEHHPDLTEARINLAAVLTETDRLDEAIAVLQPASGKPNVRRILALAYYRKGDLPAAIREFESLGAAERADADLESAVRIDPKLPGAWTWTGMARDGMSDEEGAKQAYRNALELDPGDFEANLHLGAIFYREREMAAARPFLERALRTQPG